MDEQTKWALGGACVAATLAACGTEDPVPLPPNLFEAVTGSAWNQTAVRKVLHVFAFGGFASDEQIKIWATMDPAVAVREMITLDDFNEQVAPKAESLPGGGLRALAVHWSTAGTVPEDQREYYKVDTWSSPARTWFLAASNCGTNPVRQKIGLLETYYHLAVNQDAGVNNWQMFRYYDDVMNALAASKPYAEALTIAASAAAVAAQYNHKDNRFVEGAFEGNEDFGREIHQLYFGILGVEDPEYHEVTTIRNTAKALTDMKLAEVGPANDTHSDEQITFGTVEHYPGALEVHHTQVEGATAYDKIARIIGLNIAHAETKANLPVLLISFLADDNLTPAKVDAIRAAWAAQDTPNLLEFLRSYAISKAFHDESRIKYWTSIDRNLIGCNRATLTSFEAYKRYYDAQSMAGREGVSMFRPVHNVFGGQTGIMAAVSSTVFRDAYNNSVERYWTFARAEDEKAAWKKDWAAVIPKMDDGTWRVKEMAEWLWQRFIADGLKNFGTLERAHTYALIVAGVDIAMFIDDTTPNAIYTTADIEIEHHEAFADMGIGVVPLASSNADERLTANFRIGQAINFILATPYAFAQEGK